MNTSYGAPSTAGEIPTPSNSAWSLSRTAYWSCVRDMGEMTQTVYFDGARAGSRLASAIVLLEARSCAKNTPAKSLIFLPLDARSVGRMSKREMLTALGAEQIFSRNSRSFVVSAEGPLVVTRFSVLAVGKG